MKFKFSILFFLWASCLMAQYDLEDSTVAETKEPKVNLFEIKKKTYVGGDLSLRINNQLSYVYGAPMIGYEFYPNVSAGVTGIYQLIRINNNGSIVTEHTVGGGLFLRYKPFNFLMFQTEFDILNTENYSSAPGNRINIPVYLFGGGYCGSMGDRAYYNITLMWDFIDHDHMPVPSIFANWPIYLRYGFTFYLG